VVVISYPGSRKFFLGLFLLFRSSDEVLLEVPRVLETLLQQGYVVASKVDARFIAGH
jgi:hypothetical protein